VLGGGDGGRPARAASAAATDPAQTALPPEPALDVAVHVAGAVRRPGVYRLPAGSRALDAVERAGGATRRADLDAVNLAALVVDGERIVVPRKPPPGVAAAGGGAAGSADAGASAPPAIVHLNGATVEALDALPGVGPALAERIVAFGRENGGFRSVDDLQEVPGIGPVRLEALRGLVAP
jgi:competence protein ComEA